MSGILHSHGGRRMTVSGVGLVELISNDEGEVVRVIVQEALSSEQEQRLRDWLINEWPKRTN